MKKLFFITFFIANTALAYFPVGECFNAQMNFGFGNNMGFGTNGFGGGNGCCGGSGFGLSGNASSLMVPTGYSFNNPYAYYNGFGGNPMMMSMYGNSPYMNPMAGAGVRVGLNMGPIAPMLMQLMTGGIYVGAGLGAGYGYGSGVYNGGRMGPMPMNYGNMNQPYMNNSFRY
ncbi:MAG: hypothetical protein JNM93_00085 [Bacteriovoracaceae bacterium]|nr:hypothetical protein [Bacteriovoracaceae bacterium]